MRWKTPGDVTVVSNFMSVAFPHFTVKMGRSIFIQAYLYFCILCKEPYPYSNSLLGFELCIMQKLLGEIFFRIFEFQSCQKSPQGSGNEEFSQCTQICLQTAWI